MNTANWIPDLFMQRVIEDSDWTLFSPDEVPLLTETYGTEWQDAYKQYEKDAACGKIKLSKKTSAVGLFRKMIGMIYETGHPWMTWSDPCNARYTNKHVGIVRSSNLCVTGDTKVLTRDGQVAIQDISGTTQEAWNGEEWSETEFFQTSEGQEVVTVVTKKGSVVRCTKYHRWSIVAADGTVVIKETKDLEEGDIIEEFTLPSESPAVKIKDSIASITYLGEITPTYCGTEPKRNKLIFNGVMTMNCTEITLHSSETETAVCNLGSVNVANHIVSISKEHPLGIDLDKLEKTVTTAMRMLDNVININYYASDKARNSNLKHRPVGLGMMGFQDALYKLRMSYDSREAVYLRSFIQEAISFFAIKASALLAEERGVYETFEGSDWDKGILPKDSWEIFKKYRSDMSMIEDLSPTLELAPSEMPWDEVYSLINQYGMRNSNTLAIAPTATISNICGVSQSTEPSYQNYYVKSNASGEFSLMNNYMINHLKEAGLWSDDMMAYIVTHEGDISKHPDIPDNIKTIYKTAFDIPPSRLIECAVAGQRWIDQAASLNLYADNPTGRSLFDMYMMAWKEGLKTTYYLRSQGASKQERVDIAPVPKPEASIGDSDSISGHKAKPSMCSILEPDCDACQ